MINSLKNKLTMTGVAFGGNVEKFRQFYFPKNK